MKYLERSVENKKIIWFEKENQYLLVEEPAYQIICQLDENKTLGEIVHWCGESYDMPKGESSLYVKEVQQLYEKLRLEMVHEVQLLRQEGVEVVPEKFFSRKWYQLNDCVISIEFETEAMEYMVHPKFAHLEIISGTGSQHSFQLFNHQDEFVLRINGSVIGQWVEEEANFLTGKISMEILNRLYEKEEAHWLGVFHASAVSKANRCVLFLGDSGNGKSTICALLMANGFNLVADDFVPLEADSGQVFSFPAALSVKKTAMDHLKTYYSQLDAATEFHYPDMDKTVRYLPSVSQMNSPISSFTCEALIFIRYENDSGMIFEAMPKEEAFQHLVPDSWLSPLSENAERFLDWFLEKPCYRLTYSDNTLMIQMMNNLLPNEYE